MFGLWSSHSWSTGINPTLGPDVWFVEFSLLVNRYQSHTWSRCLVCGVLTPGQPVSIPHLIQMFGWWSSHSWSPVSIPHLVQMFGLWSSHSWSPVSILMLAVADPLICSVLLCNVTKSLKEAVADPTWCTCRYVYSVQQ